MVSEQALARNKVGFAIAVEIAQLQRMKLAEFRVGPVRLKAALAADNHLLQPGQAVSVGRADDNVIQTILIHIMYEDGVRSAAAPAFGRLELIIVMKPPGRISRTSGLLIPTHRRNDIDSSVAVDVT